MKHYLENLKNVVYVVGHWVGLGIIWRDVGNMLNMKTINQKSQS